MTKTRTEIFIATDETCIIRRKRIFVRAWCKDCRCEVSMIPPSEAALLICRDTAEIISMIEGNRIHYFNFKAETLLICLRSLCLI